VAAWDAIYGPSSKRRGFTYAKATGNSSLRPHIYKWHLLEYLTQALENSWPIVVKEVRMLQTQGFSIEEMKAHVEKGGDLTSLPPRQNAGAASGPRDRSSVPEFSVSTFHQFLLSFIVADDQVSGFDLRIFLYFILLNRP
jgi:biotin operon repressor